MSSRQIDGELLRSFLHQGDWHEGSNENLGLREQLDYGFIVEILRSFKEAPDSETCRAHLGLIVLALGVAHWGIRHTPSDLDDPQGDSWRGPTPGRGKHLMSVTAGGVGLPHMDVEYLADFLSKIAVPLCSSPERSILAEVIEYLTTNGSFAKLKSNGGERWRVFAAVTERALGTESGQRWVLERWISLYWSKSLTIAVREGRDVAEAIVNARIRNSSSATANCAFDMAAGKADPVRSQLDAYVSGCPGSKSDHKRRFGYMMRPVVLYRSIG